MGTASQALNQSPKVAEETRRRVEEAADTLGYISKNRVGHQPLPPQLSVVGVLGRHEEEDINLVNPFYSHVYAGIEVECRRVNLGLMFSNVEVDENNYPLEWPAMITNKLVDGLIFTGAKLEGAIGTINKRLNVPTVLIDYYEPDLNYDSVLTDNAQGANLAVTHLIGLGHKRIGMIGSKQNSVPSIDERRQSYIKTLQDHHLFNEDYIENSELDRIAAYQAAQRLLARCPDITGIFACNDDSAAGVIQACQDAGLRIPGDISVVGFDDINLANAMNPRLTTIHVNKDWMGILGVRTLLARGNNPEMPKTFTRIATRLVVRETTAPPAE